jgi:hypothetical protein
MPIEHRVDSATSILFVTRSGHIKTRDEELALDHRMKDPLIAPGIPVLVDCRRVNPAESTKTVKYLAKQVTNLAAELQCGPVAIIVSTDVDYGMARMYMMLTELAHPNSMVFRDYEDGMAWLISQVGYKRGAIPD